MNRLDEYITTQLGMDCSQWDDEMKIHAVINAAEKMQRDFNTIVERHIELRNMVSKWNNEYFNWFNTNSSQN